MCFKEVAIAAKPCASQQKELTFKLFKQVKWAIQSGQGAEALAELYSDKRIIRPPLMTSFSRF